MVMFLVRYTWWHYATAPKLLYHVWFNLVWYMGHVFAVGKLGRSLFAPWKRVVAKRTKRWDFEDMASAFVANTMSRVVGAIMRLTLMIVGLIVQVTAMFAGLLFYCTWFFLPILIAGTFLYGVMLMV